jgi:hypothetical protein
MFSLFLVCLSLMVFALDCFCQISPAFDPDCYFPEIGNPDEIDTIYGSEPEQQLGERVINLGIAGKSGYPDILISNLPKSIGFQTHVPTGPAFDLESARKLMGPNSNLPGGTSQFKKVHLQSRDRVDLMFEYTIYWADENGMYDKDRVTNLRSSLAGKLGYTFTMKPVVGYFSSDTVQDVILAVVTRWVPFGSDDDTTYLLYYKGGATLRAKGGLALQDTSLSIGVRRVSITHCAGDWRGTGREDIMFETHPGNVFLYRNERPFSLDKVKHSLFFDTLFTLWENPSYVKGFGFENAFSMRALAKPDWDRSQDFLPALTTNDDRNSSIWFFRGGPQFGSKRLKLEDAEYIIRSPLYYDWRFTNMRFPGGLIDCGDMTGTGNRVLLSINGDGSSNINFFYVTGAALDDKVDMYYITDRPGGGSIDTITANNDPLQDLLYGMPIYTRQLHWDQGHKNFGTLHLIKGTMKIPVRVSRIVTPGGALQTDLIAYPNPAKTYTMLRYSFERGSSVNCEVFDALGRSVHHISWQALGGTEEYRLPLPQLPAGSYVIRLRTESDLKECVLAVTD